MNWELLYRKFMIFCGMNSVTGILRWPKVRLWKAQEDPKAAGEALWTLRTALTQGLEAASSVHAVYHRRDLLYTSSRRRIHHDLRLAGIQRRDGTSRKQSLLLKASRK